jgi:hypothetical protein
MTSRAGRAGAPGPPGSKPPGRDLRIAGTKRGRVRHTAVEQQLEQATLVIELVLTTTSTRRAASAGTSAKSRRCAPGRRS